MNKWEALHTFWSSFTLPAYDMHSVPDNAVMPYITYEARTDSLDYKVAAAATIWYRTSSWAEISQKADEIGLYIDTMRSPIKIDGGYMWIVRDNPFAMRFPEQNDADVRTIELNILIEYLTEH